MTSPPNVLVLMTDEHDPRISGPYGEPGVHTPALDRLAAGGTVLEQAYCNSPLCVPSRMSFMTGRYVHRIDAWDNGAVLRSDEPTWAHRLEAAGYETSLIGKMHFQGLDQLHGFRSRPVAEIHGGGPLGDLPAWRPGPGEAIEVPTVPAGVAAMRRRILGAGPGRSTNIAYDEAVRDATVSFLRARGPGGTPFALCASFISPHFPLVAPPEDFARYWPHGVDLPRLPRGRHPFHRRLIEHFDLEGFSEEEILRARAAYFGLCTFVDRLIGEVLDALEACGHAEDTLVVYTADHGEMLGEHGLWWKCNFYEPSVRVPLILRLPGRIPAGGRRGQVCSLVDLVPTLLEYAGARADPAALDGDSLRAVLERPEAPVARAWKDEAFSEYHAHASAHPMCMLRRGRFKLNYVLDEPSELYDLEADPGETTDLAGRPEYAGVVGELTRRALRDWPARELEARQAAQRRARGLLGAGRRQRG